MNNIYFEYEQKVFMKPSERKVLVPPLFKKNNEETEVKPKSNHINLGNLFGNDEKGIFKQVKKKIRQQVKQNEALS